MLRSMLQPVIVIALILGIGGAWAITETVEAVNDRILGAASRAIAESLAVEEGAVTLDLSPAIFGMLENEDRDNIFYSVRYRGRVVTGYGDLPTIGGGISGDSDLRFGHASYRGRDVRIVSEAVRLAGLSDPVIVEVAETVAARERMTRRLLIGLAVLELLLIGAMALLIPRAIKWSLRPVLALRAELDVRHPADLKPLPLADVPAELYELVVASNDMLARLEEGLDTMRRFTADASHEMRTPLSVLRGHIALLRDPAISAEDARISIADIDQASEKLSRLLTQLIALARAESAISVPTELQTTDMNTLAADVAGEIALEALRVGVELRFEPAPTPAMALTRAPLAIELLAVLADNAVRHNENGGEVSIAVIAHPAHIVVAIEDDGPGISPGERAQMFERFARHETSADRGGSGLGLSIAHALARALGAELHLATARGGRGLRAEVHLPRACGK